MRKYIWASLILIAVSCSKKKSYSCVAIVDDVSISGVITEKEEDPKIIEAETDSIAFLEAYQKFIIAQKSQADMRAAGAKIFNTIKSFKLMNSEGADITNVSFKSKDSLMAVTMSSIMGRESFIKESRLESKSKDAEIDHQFSKWDGAHIKTEEYIKAGLKDPDSYKHVSSQYKIYPDYLEVRLTYRGKNSFNATVTEVVRTKCDLDTGEVLEIIN